MAYDPHVWNVMHERQYLLTCPFCGYTGVEEQKGNTERQYRIACGNPHCEVNPHTFAQYDLEEVVISWQLRKPIAAGSPCAKAIREEMEKA